MKFRVEGESPIAPDTPNQDDKPCARDCRSIPDLWCERFSVFDPHLECEIQRICQGKRGTLKAAKAMILPYLYTDWIEGHSEALIDFGGFSSSEHKACLA